MLRRRRRRHVTPASGPACDAGRRGGSHHGLTCRPAQAYEGGKSRTRTLRKELSMRILPRGFAIVGWVLAFGTGLPLARPWEKSAAPSSTRAAAASRRHRRGLLARAQGSRTTATGSGERSAPALLRVRTASSSPGRLRKAEQQTQVRLDATASVAITSRWFLRADRGDGRGAGRRREHHDGREQLRLERDRPAAGRPHYTDIVKSNPGVSQDRADRQPPRR